MPQHEKKIQSMSLAQKARANNVRIIKFLAIIVTIFLAFITGFLLRGERVLLLPLDIPPIFGEVDSSSGTGISHSTYESLGARVSEVEEIINEDSLDNFDLDATTFNVLDAFAQSTEDPYLCYYNDERYEVLQSEAAQGYSGIGVLFSEYEGQAYVVDVFEGSSAQLSGVEVGDIVIGINGEDDFTWTMAETVAELSLNEGENVVMTWMRPSDSGSDEDNQFTTILTCSEASAPNVQTELVDTVGYISLAQITQNSSELVEQAIEELSNQGALSFVLDLRNNPGGYLTQAVDIASFFVPSGTIVKIETEASEDGVKSATGAVATDKPLVVLVNRNTASSAEVLAAALQDNKRATLIGETTLGKGSVQVTKELSFGGALRYTVAYYKTPLGYDIDGVGVKPSLEISLSDSSDNQKSLALETARSMAVG